MGNEAPQKTATEVRRELLARLGEPDVTEEEVELIKKKLEVVRHYE